MLTGKSVAVCRSDEVNDYLCRWEERLLKGHVTQSGSESRSSEPRQPLKVTVNSQIWMTAQECGFKKKKKHFFCRAGHWEKGGVEGWGVEKAKEGDEQERMSWVTWMFWVRTKHLKDEENVIVFVVLNEYSCMQSSISVSHFISHSHPFQTSFDFLQLQEHFDCTVD